MNPKIYMTGTNFEGPEALLKMSDDWIDSGSCSHKTVMDLRDYAKELQHEISTLRTELSECQQDRDRLINTRSTTAQAMTYASLLQQYNELRTGYKNALEAIQPEHNKAWCLKEFGHLCSQHEVLSTPLAIEVMKGDKV